MKFTFNLNKKEFSMKKAKMLSLTASLVLAITFTFSCSSGDGGGNKPPEIIYGPTVGHGGETYQTVVIGTQTWFARNSNYDVNGSKCYNNEPSNCTIYGRLYNWEGVFMACPSGWHSPTNAEWETLINYVGGWSNAGKKLKARSGWSNNGNGTDDYGFSALPGGYGDSDGYFEDVGLAGYWWNGFTQYQGIYYDAAGAYSSTRDVDYFYSVRCLQD